MNVSQEQFSAALLDAQVPLPAGLVAPDGHTAGRRFDVYRNNVVVSLCDALATAFPLVFKLLGSENFNGLAALFVRRHPPDSPLMMYYGAEFPDFLRNFRPLAHLGYLADCADLDLALRRSYHAADATPFNPQVLDVPPEALPAVHLDPAPATQVLRSDWPLFDLWRYNTTTDAAKPKAVAQDVLITRPEFDPVPYLLPPGGAIWLEALSAGRTLGEAHEQAVSEIPDFDLSGALSLALQSKTLTGSPKKDRN